MSGLELFLAGVAKGASEAIADKAAEMIIDGVEKVVVVPVNRALDDSRNRDAPWTDSDWVTDHERAICARAKPGIIQFAQRHGYQHNDFANFVHKDENHGIHIENLIWNRKWESPMDYIAYGDYPKD